MTKLLAVVDGDEGADIYGHALDETEALAIAEQNFVDAIVKIERYGPIRLANGQTLPEAFVVFTQ